MNLLSIDSISKTIANKLLFSNISFGIEEGEKVALIGINGCGKSTLLKIIAGIEKNDTGKVSKNGGLKINFLNQIPKYNMTDTIKDHIFKTDNIITRLIGRYEELCKLVGENNSYDNEFHEVMEKMDKENVWDYEHEITSILNELNIDDLSVNMSKLSGGALKKVALAETLIGDANLLLMDEPTNHLDVKTIQYLENYLLKTSKSLILVTHDRYFLDNVCNTIIEIDRNIITKFEGNYSYYLEKKSQLEEHMMKEDDRVENILRKELEWYKRQPKARTTKSKSRMDSIDEMMTHETFRKKENVELSISGKRLGKKILELDNICKSFDNKILINNFSYVFKQNEKIGIVGPNGCGKSTFLNLITGLLKPDSGTIDKGINTVFGYFTQNKEEFNPDLRVIDYIKSIAEMITLSNGKTISAGKMLEKFLFSAGMHYHTISTLSGGERRRLYLLSILMKNPNFLILDEPTNDFDIKTLSILEDFLIEFGGCLIIVSHDRYFMNRITDTLLSFKENGEIISFPGSYSEYLEYDEFSKQKVITEKPVFEKNIIEKKPEEKKPKLTFKEKKELETLEEEIDKLETEKKQLEQKFSNGNNKSPDLLNWTKRYSEIEDILSKNIKRWEYLAGLE